MFFKQYVKNSATVHDYLNLQFAITELSDYITKRKNEYNFQLSQSLNKPAASAKTYWTILRTFYSGKKIPLILPLVIKDQLKADFREKASFFSLYFAKQCTPIKNDSFIPAETNCLSDVTILAVDFEDQDIVKIIRALDNISTHMIKICDSSIVKNGFAILESIIFCKSLNSQNLSDNWKISNIIPAHKKGNKQLIQNYRHMSLLPINNKIFERLIFSSLYKFVEESSLFCSNQSGFGKTDPCANQFLSIVHEIYESFNNFPSLETHSEVLDMSKAFDTVWHEGLIYKLRTIGISKNLLTLFQSFWIIDIKESYLMVKIPIGN